MKMNPIKPIIRSIPDSLHIAVLSRLFNHLLRGQVFREDLDGLEGKKICIRATDTDNTIIFHIRNNQIYPASSSQSPPWDARISGTISDLMSLLTRTEDPDTLFFERRLSMEGETETALYLKNMMDAADFDWEKHIKSIMGNRLAAPIIHIEKKYKIEKRIKTLVSRQSL